MSFLIINSILILAVPGLQASLSLRVQLHSSVTGAPVSGAAVIFAIEGRSGPYPSTTSDTNGEFKAPEGYAGSILILHPSFLAREISAAELSVPVLLVPGNAIDDPHGITRQPGALVRAYPVSWVGRFDVEELPPMAHNDTLRCAASDIVFDISLPGCRRVVRRGGIPDAPPDSAITRDVTMRVEQSPSATSLGVVYLARDVAAARLLTGEVPRSRLLNEGAVVRFNGVTLGERYVVVVAPVGSAPIARRVQVMAEAHTIKIKSSPPLEVAAQLRCDHPPKNVILSATLQMRDLESVEIGRQVRLNAEGKIRIPDLGPGSLKLVVSARERRDLIRTVVLSSDRPLIQLGGLCPAAPFLIRGMVTDDDDRPLKSSNVVYGDAQWVTGNDGVFQLVATKPAQGPLLAMAEGYLPWQRWFEPSDDTPTSLKIKLTKGVRYRGSVIDGRTGQAVHRFSLQCYRLGEGPKRAFDHEMTLQKGSFMTPLLPPDVEEIVLSASGYETLRRQVQAPIRGNGNNRVRDIGVLELAPASRIMGRVVDGSANPLSGALIRVRSKNLPGWDAGTQGFNLFEGTSHADGSFELPVAAGTYVLLASAVGFAPSEKVDVTVSDAADVGTIELQQGCSLEVRVMTSAGTAAAGGVVELHRGTADDKREIQELPIPDDGSATFPNIGPGDYTLLVRRSRRLTEMPLHLDADSCPIHPLTLQVGSTRVRGFATERGRPLTDAVLTLFPAAAVASPTLTVVRQQTDPNGRTTTQEVVGGAASAIVLQTDSTGFFIADDVGAGDYRLIAQHGDMSRSRVITIPDVDVFDASTDFGATAISGLVVEAGSAKALPESTVALENRTGVAVETSVTDALGRFELGNDSGEGIRIRASHDGYTTERVAVSDAQPFTIALRKGVFVLRGVVTHDGVPIANALVVWRLNSDSTRLASGATSTNPNGEFETDELVAGDLTLAVGAGGFGVAFNRTLLSNDTATPLTIALHRPSALRVRLPDNLNLQQIRLLFDGNDVTELLWRIPNATPRPIGESQWTWDSLSPGTYAVVAGDRAKTVSLREGEEKEVSFGK